MPHIHELIDYTAEIFIVYHHKVLIRLHDKYNLRTCPGGHIELDENPNEAAIREAKEETGLDVVLYNKHQQYFGEHEGQKELIPPIFMNIHRI
jgi:8-oxo-dGTP pyrophosphatase MutT (NUDIX family)